MDGSARRGGGVRNRLRDRRRPAGRRGPRNRLSCLVFAAPAIGWGGAVAAGLVGAAGPLAAQEELARACAQQTAVNAPLCHRLAQAAAIAQPRIALAGSGGNPVPGAASTLGFGLASSPRLTLGARVTAAHMTLPPLNSPDDVSVTPIALALDGALGLFEGFRPSPSVGGVGSLDLLGSFGMLVRVGDRFRGTPTALGIGARVGIMRESFTAPGITLSGMYRRVGKTSFAGDPTDPRVDPATGPQRFDLDATGDWSFRAIVGKRLLGLGASAGLGLDRLATDVTIGPTNGSVVNPVVFTVGPRRLTQTRPSVFAAISWTKFVLSGVAEAGWQKGGSPAAVSPATGQEHLVRQGAFFGSLALRVTL